MKEEGEEVGGSQQRLSKLHSNLLTYNSSISAEHSHEPTDEVLGLLVPLLPQGVNSVTKPHLLLLRGTDIHQQVTMGHDTEHCLYKYTHIWLIQ